MELINYILALLVSYFGLLAGFFLAWIAPEELDQGQKYFLLLQKILLILIIAVTFHFYALNKYWILVICLAVFALLYRINDLNSCLLYFFLGSIFFLGIKDASLFMLLSSLVFIYGLPTGTLFFKKFMKKGFIISRLLLYHLGYIIIGLLLYYFSTI